MKASVQYGDYKGTAAADISDHESLEAAAERFGIDTSRFDPIGVSFYSGYEDFFSGSILALDKNNSAENDPYIVQIGFDVSREEFFGMFKRFNVVLESRFTDYEDVDVRDSIRLEDE